MKKYTQKDVATFPVIDGIRKCPKGRYDDCNFCSNCSFGSGSSFASNCKFATGCSFASGCVFW